MQGVGTIVGGQVVADAAIGETGVGQPIGITANDGTEVGEVVLGQVVGGSVKSQHHIGARHCQTHQAATHISEFGLYQAIRKGDGLNLFQGLKGLKGLKVKGSY
jgi:hypothetical protein